VTNLTAKLRAKLAFDWSTMRKYAVDERSRNGRDADGFADGASAENARLQPLHAAMLGVIEAAVHARDTQCPHYAELKCTCVRDTAHMAIAELERAL
jgi:hypothetical protein